MEKSLTVIPDTLDQLLESIGVSTQQIVNLYSGLDHECRCGCKGRYFKPEDRSWKRMLNRLKKAVANRTVRFAEVTYDVTPDPADRNFYTVDYVNIPDGTRYNDHCFCLYFTE